MPEKRKHKKKNTSKKRLPRKIEKSKTIIEISEMHKWFGSFHVLKDINLRISAGEKIVV